MVVAVPTTPVTLTGTASSWGQQVVTDLSTLLNPVIFSGGQTATQSLTSATLTAITYETETIDTYSGHSTSVNTSRYTVPAACNGWRLQFNAIVGITANATGGRAIEIHKNGSAIPNSRVAVGSATATNATFIQVVCTGIVATGDFFEVFASQASGGALSTVAGSSFEISFDGLS